MKKYFIIFIFITNTSKAQDLETNALIENTIESIDIEEQGVDNSDEEYTSNLISFSRNKIEINEADEEKLSKLKILTPIQLKSFFYYRKINGILLSIYELQSIPFFDLNTIKKLQPFIKVSKMNQLNQILQKSLEDEWHFILLRYTNKFQRCEGFKFDSSIMGTPYIGSPFSLRIKYKYHFKDKLAFGLSMEKDAGEPLIFNGKKPVMDFNSMHLTLSKIGCLQSFILGDYSLNIGQGLVLWQGMSFGKSAAVINIKKQSEKLLSYHSFGESNFQRGAALMLRFKKISMLLFLSRKGIDANAVVDTNNGRISNVTSIQNSGLHRTDAEIFDKNVQRLSSIGASMGYRFHSFIFNFNFVKNNFAIPILKENTPYLFYSLKGKSFLNGGLDYSYTDRNFHFFGEVAISEKMSAAILNGLMISISPKLDLSILHRNISKSYQSINARAFTENSTVNNESGVYSGFAFKIDNNWQFAAYVDKFRFPWLKYQIDRPSGGYDLLFRLTGSFKKKSTIYFQCKSQSKQKNNENEFNLTLDSYRQSAIRFHIDHSVSRTISIRNRIEMNWVKNEKNIDYEGFMICGDLFFKSMTTKYSFNGRLMFFNTDGYENRIYSFEPDLDYNYSFSTFYDKGVNWCFNFKYDLSKKVSIGVKFAGSHFFQKNEIGSGFDKINSNKITEIKGQILMEL